MSRSRLKKTLRRTFYRSVQAMLPLSVRDALRSFLLRQDPAARRDEQRRRREQVMHEKTEAKRLRAAEKAERRAEREKTRPADSR